MEDQILREVFIDQIKDRVQYRAFYRAHRWMQFAELESENTLVLRALLKVRSAARRASRIAERHHERWARSHGYVR